jgi:hypothetical protein
VYWFEITSGPYKGNKAIAFRPISYFLFQRLLPELRLEIYRLVFANDSPVFIGKPT